MARVARDNLHSKAVFVLKVVLPLLALAILSTLFLVSRKINPEDAIPYADVDIEDRLRDPKMTGAGLAGMTKDGSAISLSAGEAKPDTGTGGKLQQVLGSLRTADGGLSEIAAAAIGIDAAAHQITLSGGAEFRTPTGYEIVADGLTIATNRTQVESLGPVSVDGPVGQLTADHMLFTSLSGRDGPFVLVFNGQVRLLYQPQR
jgi:lipopolysaccharide export system protein LptC